MWHVCHSCMGKQKMMQCMMGDATGICRAFLNKLPSFCVNTLVERLQATDSAGSPPPKPLTSSSASCSEAGLILENRGTSNASGAIFTASASLRSGVAVVIADTSTRSAMSLCLIRAGIRANLLIVLIVLKPYVGINVHTYEQSIFPGIRSKTI